MRLHLRLVDKGTIDPQSRFQRVSRCPIAATARGADLRRLAETLAAGISLLAGYDGSEPLLDPMCGTGTFAVEAALIATHTPPGLHRAFAFERWGVHDQLTFEEVQHEASHGHRDAPQPIIARDRAERSLRATHATSRPRGWISWVELEQRDALDLLLAVGHPAA